MEKIYDMIIVGGGPGGYTAALYGTRAGLSVAVLEKLSAGGQIALTSQVDNYPGFEEGIDGYILGEKMKLGAERFGAETKMVEVLSVELNDKIKKVETTDGTYYGRTVVLSTGASHRELGLEGEESLVGRGVSYCATCDGMFYRDRTAVIIGGGNTAVAEALHLSRICEKVILVHRRDTLKADKIYHDPLMKAENVEFYWNSTVSEFIYGDELKGLKIKNVNTGEETVIDCDGAFISIGRKPATELVKGQIDLDENGYIISDETTRTNIPGVFAVGDVRTKIVRQVVTAVADGANASHYAEEYLAGEI